MTKKGLTIRERNVRPHRYRPAKPEEKTQAGLLDDLANRAFDGSVRKLLIRAVQDGNLDRDELGEIRKLIDDLRRDKQGEK
jgi:predicted transcriptional regulator